MLKLAVLALPALFALPAAFQDEGDGAMETGTGTYVIDKAHSFITFKCKHLGVSYSYGRFNEMEGSFSFDAENPDKSSIQITVDAASIDTNSEKRDKHLRSPDFFNVLQFPSIKFESTGFKKSGDKKYEISGKLTLLGKTKEISFPVEHVGVGKMRRTTKTGFEGSFVIQRQDFGMNYMPDALGTDVKIWVSLEGNKR